MNLDTVFSTPSPSEAESSDDENAQLQNVQVATFPSDWSEYFPSFHDPASNNFQDFLPEYLPINRNVQVFVNYPETRNRRRGSPKGGARCRSCGRFKSSRSPPKRRYRSRSGSSPRHRRIATRTVRFQDDISENWSIRNKLPWLLFMALALWMVYQYAQFFSI